MEYALILAMPLLFLGIGLAIVRFRKLSWSEDVGFKMPSAAQVAIWLAAFAVLFFAQELFSGSESAAASWRGKYDAGQIAIRIVAVGLIYPIAEEFFFRGVFLGVLRTKAGAVVAVLVTAVVFALVHTQYDWPVWILLDGLLFGAARVSSGSVYVPMLLHVIGNSYGVWERLQ